MTIGTGIGGGLILDGKLYHGSSDAAGEIGHTTIDSTGRRCKCGNYGCLEAYASGPAIAERAREHLQVDGDSILCAIVDGDVTRITAQTVFEASKRGDPVAIEVVRDTAHFIGVGIANLINVFNPDMVVIAGGVTQAGDPALRSNARRGSASSVQVRGGGVPDCAWRSPPFRRRCRRRRYLQGADARRLVAIVKRRVGVIGSFVWDVIHGRDPHDSPVEEWGGITYALGALDAALPDDWDIVPLVKVGFDLVDRRAALCGSSTRSPLTPRRLKCLITTIACRLHYQSAERRCERLTGGVPAGIGSVSSRCCRDLDALYINLISGFELDLETAQLIRSHFKGPIYCDLHSLVLAVQPDGIRTLQPLPNPARGAGASTSSR